MQIYRGESLERYKQNNLQYDPNWNHRDFVFLVEQYFTSQTERVLAVGGLRGTGKTTGILQAAEGLDATYVLAQKEDGKTGKDYVEFLKSCDSRCIAIDEYGWIKDREDLDYYLLTAVQDGKRIVITGTESISLDMLNYGALCHRVGMIHTTMFPYEEYLRIYNLNHSPKNCDDYLLRGGIFKEYVLNNFATTREYVEKALVENLSDYFGDGYSVDKARALTYAVLFKAICPSNLSSIPVLHQSKVELPNFLDAMGINANAHVEDGDVGRVADLFEQIGVIVRIPNYDKESSLKEQYYITNPSLTCQLIKAAYNLDTISNDILGHVFEASVAVQLYTNRLADHKIFFLNSEGRSNVPTKELDIILTDRAEENVWLFECKHTHSDRIKSDATLLSGYLERNCFQYADVEGRYVVYNGSPAVKDYEVGTVLFTPIGDMLNNYFQFEHNVKTVDPGHGIKDDHDNDDHNQTPPVQDGRAKRYADMVKDRLRGLKESVESIIAGQRDRVERSFEVREELRREKVAHSQDYEISL